MNDSNHEYPIKDNIKNAVDELVDNYTSNHSRSTVVRFDVHYPQDYTEVKDNKHISQCVAKLNQKFDRKGFDPRYVWTREQDSSPHPHFHCAMLLDGNKTQSPYRVFAAAKDVWGKTIQADPTGLIHHCMESKDGTPHPNGIMLKRNAEDYESKRNEVDRQLSYLYKAKDKGDPKDGLRDFGISRKHKRSKE